jgi:hypothetical protein
MRVNDIDFHTAVISSYNTMLTTSWLKTGKVKSNQSLDYPNGNYARWVIKIHVTMRKEFHRTVKGFGKVRIDE